MTKRMSFVRAMVRVVPILAILAAPACGGKNPVSVSIMGSNSQSFTVPAGAEFTVTLQNIGPSEYSSPPPVSSGAVQFLDVSIVGPNAPGGSKQQFRFNAATRGTAIVAFQNTGMNRTVEDTVQVR